MQEWVLVGLPIAAALAILSRALVKTGRQTQLMQLQGREIQKQVRELEQRNEELQKLNQEKMQVISLVSHDLKGPFNRIFALTQLLSLHQENLTETQAEYLAKIHQITADGLSMVRNILDSRRLEEQGIEINLAPLDFTSLVGNLVKNYRVLAEKKKIEILFDAGKQLVINTDKLYAGRIIDNLLSNAVKFSPEGKTITVSLCKNDRAVDLSVADQGPGISAEDQQNLFRRFKQLTARPTGGESSSGLGLFIAKTISDKIGGEIFCESKIGEGARFVLRLRG